MNQADHTGRPVSLWIRPALREDRWEVCVCVWGAADVGVIRCDTREEAEQMVDLLRRAVLLPLGGRITGEAEGHV